MLSDLQKTILLILVLLKLNCQKTITLSCESTPDRCQSGFSYRILGDSLNEAICLEPNKTCDLSSNVQLEVNYCDFDYESTICGSGVCFYSANTPISVSKQICSQSYTHEMSCEKCAFAPCNSQICQQISKNNSNSVTNCVLGCPIPSSSKFKISPCPGNQDSLGSEGKCCATFAGVGAPICSTRSFVLTASQQFYPWVKGIIKLKGSSEKIIQILGILAIMLVTIVLM